MKIIEFIIGLIKFILKSSILLILIALILISIQDYISNDDLKNFLEIVSIALFGVYFIYETYKDLKNNKYKTYQYYYDVVKWFDFIWSEKY